MTETSEHYACPACGTLIEATPRNDAQHFLCPDCGAEFIVPGISGNTDDDAGGSVELDGLRIRRLTSELRQRRRRSTILLVPFVLCLVGAIQLTLNVVRRAGEGPWSMDLTWLAIGAGALLAMAMALLFRMARTTPAPRLPADSPPPDFSKMQ